VAAGGNITSRIIHPVPRFRESRYHDHTQVGVAVLRHPERRQWHAPTRNATCFLLLFLLLRLLSLGLLADVVFLILSVVPLLRPAGCLVLSISLSLSLSLYISDAAGCPNISVTSP